MSQAPGEKLHWNGWCGLNSRRPRKSNCFPRSNLLASGFPSCHLFHHHLPNHPDTNTPTKTIVAPRRNTCWITFPLFYVTPQHMLICGQVKWNNKFMKHLTSCREGETFLAIPKNLYIWWKKRGSHWFFL